MSAGASSDRYCGCTWYAGPQNPFGRMDMQRDKLGSSHRSQRSCHAATSVNTRGAALSSYDKTCSVVSKAIAYIIMNISGVRPGLEDMSEMGHESRFGNMFGENIEDSPWPPLHTDYGFAPGDSCVTLFWPQEHTGVPGSADMSVTLSNLCKLDARGWAPGAAIVVSPKVADAFAKAGWSKKRAIDYIVEYNRQPATQVKRRWLIGNNHLDGVEVDLPLSPELSSRRFWSSEHLFFAVAGSDYGYSIVAYTGGGDHGGPSCTKIEVLAQWNSLCEEFADSVKYISY